MPYTISTQRLHSYGVKLRALGATNRRASESCAGVAQSVEQLIRNELPLMTFLLCKHRDLRVIYTEITQWPQSQSAVRPIRYRFDAKTTATSASASKVIQRPKPTPDRLKLAWTPVPVH